MLRYCAFVLVAVLAQSSFAQQRDIRPDDHFWRKRVVNRLSLVEKINAPLVFHASDYQNDDPRFSQIDGIVVSLIDGVLKGKYEAIHPENFSEKLDSAALIARMQEFDQALYSEEFDQEDEEDPFEFDNSEFEQPGDDLREEDWDFEEWEADFEASEQQQQEADPLPDYTIDYGPYEGVIHLIEDWVFDKNSSRMVQETDFFEIIWQDPSGTLPEKVLARFMWEDVKDQLELTKWHNRFNDGTGLSVKDVFALRVFNSIVINVGGHPVSSLYESEARKQEIIEFEHNLWSY